MMSSWMKIGQIVSALLAITIAGCLIKRQQEHNNPNSAMEMEKKDSAEQSVSSLVDDIILSSSDGEEKSFLQMDIDTFETTLQKINTKRKISTFFGSSKSGIPFEKDEIQYKFIVHKKEKTYSFSLKSYSDTKWDFFSYDIRRLYEKTQGIIKDCSVFEKIRYQKNDNTPTPIHKLSTDEIYYALVAFQTEKNNSLFAFSSSKALAPNIDPTAHSFLYVQNKTKRHATTYNTKQEEWIALKHYILDCYTDLSFPYLFPKLSK